MLCAMLAQNGGLSNGCSSVRRVCCCGPGGYDIDRMLHGRRRTTGQQHGAQQQTRVMSRLQLM